MRDIIERLRTDAGQLTIAALIQEREAAASEIERLRRTTERLSTANQSIHRPRAEPARRTVEGSASALAPGALLRLTEVCKLLGNSRSTVYKWISDDTFPRPFKISQRAVRWRAEDIACWREALNQHERV